MATYAIIAGIIAALSVGAALLFRRYRRTVEQNGKLAAKNEKLGGDNEILGKQIGAVTDHGVPSAADKLQDGKF